MVWALMQWDEEKKHTLRNVSILARVNSLSLAVRPPTT